jgi:hypothetical protein
MEHLEPFITTRLSETQMRWWNVLHPVEQAQASPYQFLTISRDIGPPGDEIAGELAMRQGWRVYDKEIVDHIANNSRVREDMVRQLDEKTRGRMHNMILRMLRMPEEAPFGHEEYHDSLMKTLATLAARGDAILVGRGANFALRWVNMVSTCASPVPWKSGFRRSADCGRYRPKSPAAAFLRSTRNGVRSFATTLSRM